VALHGVTQHLGERGQVVGRRPGDERLRHRLLLLCSLDDRCLRGVRRGTGPRLDVADDGAGGTITANRVGPVGGRSGGRTLALLDQLLLVLLELDHLGRQLVPSDLLRRGQLAGEL
jgi:hypothetical protein